MMKTALITGGNSGIGYATAKLLKERGYQVTIAGRNADSLQQAAKALQVDWQVVELSDLAQIAEVAALFSQNGLDALVNNAALARFLPIKTHTTSDYQQFFETNIRGSMALIQALLPALSLKRGAITNVSSAVVNNGLANASLYAATKGAMDAFSKSLAVELAPQGIRVNVVAPGAIDTQIHSKLGLPSEVLAEIRLQHERTIPLRRYGQADEVAQVIHCQLEASYVTGAVWMVDGGVDAV